MSTIIEFLSIGLALGAIYGLLAIPLSLVWSMTHTIDLAVGGYAVFGGMVGATIGGGAGTVTTLGIGAALGAIMGGLYVILQSRGVDSHLPAMLISVGMLFVLLTLTQVIVGIDPIFAPWISGVFEVGGIRTRWMTLVSLGILLTVAAIAWFILQRTGAGRWVRASADSPRNATLVGIPVRRIQFTGFVVGGALSSLAGALLIASRGLSFDMGLQLTLLGLGAVILFGMRGIRTAVLGSLVLGVVESFANGYLPSQVAPIIPIALVLVVLASGIFDQRLGEVRP